MSRQRAEELKQRMQGGEPPDGLPPMELVWLHDADRETSLVIQFFDSEDDLRQAAAVLEAMPAEETPGRRTSVTTYDVAHRQSV
ncbi:MAG TPA: hypothetical protein VFB35_02445 [Gaiellaceae bacterium]|nr:hypothetical protein [Gaiellaceae bacterium]